jgi:hypothetical protein
MITPQGSKEGLYCFRGQEIKSDEWTISQLNYALALNRSKDRYVKIEKPKKDKK